MDASTLLASTRIEVRPEPTLEQVLSAPSSRSLNTNLTHQITEVQHRIQALERERDNIKSGRLAEAKGALAARVFTWLFGITSIVSVIADILDEISEDLDSRKMLLSALIINLSLVAISGIMGFIWYKHSRSEQKRAAVAIDITANRQYSDFIKAVQEYCADPTEITRAQVLRLYDDLPQVHKETLSRTTVERLLDQHAPPSSQQEDPHLSFHTHGGEFEGKEQEEMTVRVHTVEGH